MTALLFAALAMAAQPQAERQPQAQPKPVAAAAAKADAPDVIEGTRRESPIFVQLDPNAVDRSILIFKRHDFNDFHELDRKRRLKFQVAK